MPDINLAMQLLIKAVAEHPKGKAGVAKRVCCSRALLARVLSPNDALVMSPTLAQRVINALHVIPLCPATGSEQPRSECIRLASSKAPTHNPASMRTWKTCQTCPHHPEQRSKK